VSIDEEPLEALEFQQFWPGQLEVDLPSAVGQSPLTPHRCPPIQQGSQSRLGNRESYCRRNDVAMQVFRNTGEQEIDASTRGRRQPYASRHPGIRTVDSRFGPEYISLIVDLNQWQMPGADLAQYLVDLLDAFEVRRIRGIDYMQQQARFAGLLQRRFEGRYELVGQVSYESDGIGENQAPAGR
jgi:hypothetical protein